MHNWERLSRTAWGCSPGPGPLVQPLGRAWTAALEAPHLCVWFFPERNKFRGLIQANKTQKRLNVNMVLSY